MTVLRATSMRGEVGWDKPLSYRRGAACRLRGIDVYYDLAWDDHFVDRRMQFQGGQSLADQVIEDCPEGKRPALLLTDQDDVEEGALVTEQSYVVVVHLSRYTASAHDPSTAATYMARRLGRGITRAKSFSELGEVEAQEVAGWLDAHLDGEALTAWAAGNELRLELLRKIGVSGREDAADGATDLDEIVSALESLDELDPRIAEAIANLVTVETDIDARLELLWALTEDEDGRTVTAQTLQERVSDRLEDLLAAADAFEELLEGAGEKRVHQFLEHHPWLLGLEYVGVSAHQEVLRGEVDFLLERVDGYYDLLELKAPRDRIFDVNDRGADIRSPSAFRLSRPLALALAQVHAYRDVLSAEDTHERFFGLRYTREPQITILIGLASSLSDQERRILRELNRSLHRVEVMPFDVLAARARAVHDNINAHLSAATPNA